MEVNKGEAERCRDIGAQALQSGNLPRAVKFFEKSLQLFPLPGVEALLEQAKRMQQNSASDEASSPAPQQRRAPAQRSESTASASTTGADGRAYTPDQVKVVQDVLKAKQGGRGAHYRVLGLQQEASATEIKKAYRKLSLKVHPDKNSAPHADEAFKAVGLAYATLSDDQKRAVYDRYGDEDPDNRGGGMRPGGMRHGGGPEMTPEEIFAAFFGGGMPGMHAGGPGFHVYSTGFGPGMGFQQRRRPRQAAQGQQRDETPGLGALMQFAPILLMLLFSFFNIRDSDTASHRGPMPGEGKYFSLTSQLPFHNPLHTRLSKVKDIPYFVSDKFLRTYYRDRYQLAQVERMVEAAYEQYLVKECNSQVKYKRRLQQEAKDEPDEALLQKKLQRATEFELTRCVELEDLFPKRS